MQECHCVHVEIKENLARVGSLLPSGHSWRLDSGHQTWQQALFPTELSPNPPA